MVHISAHISGECSLLIVQEKRGRKNMISFYDLVLGSYLDDTIEWLVMCGLPFVHRNIICRKTMLDTIEWLVMYGLHR